ncbi:hypothetical protein GIB67_018768 [Kingdonia uniflora]|uniref:C2H2-type domain-containing protein n=1 Tax=Kingdonia uniflora TaxID=39325 RepID=A0A7J7NE36_9MAGN|nr:hypothetical protein GIB67_018768 [Kingdonia uniflora]
MGKSMAITSFLFYLSLSLLLLSFQIASSLSSNQVLDEGVPARTQNQDQEHAQQVHCSRERSRAAWKVIDEYLIPFVEQEQEQYRMSTKCKLHPANDIFRDQELHKNHIDVNEWQCGYCKKSFRAEKFLDQHFDGRHYNLLNVVPCLNPALLIFLISVLDKSCWIKSHSKCLADLCGALHCDLVMDFKVPKNKCNPAAASRNRHLCEGLADNCFPANEGPSASRLHETNKHILYCYLDIDFDVVAYILSYCLSLPEGDEDRHPRFEARLTEQTQDKTLLVECLFKLLRKKLKLAPVLAVVPKPNMCVAAFFLHVVLIVPANLDLTHHANLPIEKSRPDSDAEDVNTLDKSSFIVKPSEDFSLH